MASKKAPSKKPPITGLSSQAKNKTYVDQGARTALKGVNWKGVGTIVKAGRGTVGSEGPKKPKPSSGRITDRDLRKELNKIDWKGVGRLTESMGSQGPKKANSKATTKKKAQPKIYMPVGGGGSRVVKGRIK